MWLFVVFVVTSSYTASLTSMLTVPRLQPTVTDIEWLRRSNATVGCDGDSFVKDYLRNVLDFENVIEVGNQENYPKKFKSGNITAAFLELPYEKVFLKEYCDEYTATGPVYRFGGFGFVSTHLNSAISFGCLENEIQGKKYIVMGQSSLMNNTNFQWSYSVFLDLR